MYGTTKDLWKMVLAAGTVAVTLALAPAAVAVPAQEGGEPADRPPDAIVGTRGGDTLFGTERPDYVDALRGDDALVGRGSGDMLRSGEGDDRAAGGGGDDYFVGDAPGVGVGPDNVDRVGGDDVLHGGAGPDTVNGEGGSDTLVGGDGDDGLFTDDLINGDSAGDDAKDLASGGAGDDFVDAEDGRGLVADEISCGAGHDTVLADRADRVSLDCEVVR